MIVIKKFYYFNEDIENNNIKGEEYKKNICFLFTDRIIFWMWY